MCQVPANFYLNLPIQPAWFFGQQRRTWRNHAKPIFHFQTTVSWSFGTACAIVAQFLFAWMLSAGGTSLQRWVEEIWLPIVDVETLLQESRVKGITSSVLECTFLYSAQNYETRDRHGSHSGFAWLDVLLHGFRVNRNFSAVGVQRSKVEIYYI